MWNAYTAYHPGGYVANAGSWVNGCFPGYTNGYMYVR